MHKYLALAACLFVSFPVLAQTVEQDGANDRYSVKTELAERVFLKYHKAIRAEESCKDRDFSASDKAAMDQIVTERMEANSPDVAVGPARLLVLARNADDAMDDTISDQGCDGATVKKFLQFFDERLAAAAPNPAPVDTTAPQSLTKTGQ